MVFLPSAFLPFPIRKSIWSLSIVLYTDTKLIFIGGHSFFVYLWWKTTSNFPQFSASLFDVSNFIVFDIRSKYLKKHKAAFLRIVFCNFAVREINFSVPWSKPLVKNSWKSLKGQKWVHNILFKIALFILFFSVRQTSYKVPWSKSLAEKQLRSRKWVHTPQAQKVVWSHNDCDTWSRNDFRELRQHWGL